ncbi:MAG: desulfoferrodoxin family protein [Sulfurospirillaceae bacterium]|nr:desulfoferrodoxin family protein [Sulfurospirillaceae bacterium]MDD2827524.1 desulfoferrodoxin family protein [Sulfurospirillaceae bacterium]
MKRRDAIKLAALAALATTYASAYDEKLIVNKKKMQIKDSANPTELELKHSPEIKVGVVDAKGYSLVEVNIGQKGIIHPSDDKHWIYEIELLADAKKVASVSLEPTISRGYLAARVNTKDVKVLSAISKCNLHGEYSASITL